MIGRQLTQLAVADMGEIRVQELPERHDRASAYPRAWTLLHGSGRRAVLPHSEPALVLLRVENVRDLRPGHARDSIELPHTGSALVPHPLEELDGKGVAVTEAEEVRRERPDRSIGRGEVRKQETENDVGNRREGDSPGRLGSFMFPQRLQSRKPPVSHPEVAKVTARSSRPHLGKLVLRVLCKALEHLESEQPDPFKFVLRGFGPEPEASPPVRFVDVLQLRRDPDLVKQVIVVFGDRGRARRLQVCLQARLQRRET